jgi:hypothetical protein
VNLVQPMLLEVPMAGVVPVSLGEANRLLVAWGHKFGELHRPFANLPYVLTIQGRPISVAVSSSIVSPTVLDYDRTEVVECARLCSDPAHSWASRIMLRLWREVCAPSWPYWQVRAVVSYSANAHHSGNLYRFDGWTRATDRAGSNGGGTWSGKREEGDPLRGSKSLWIWRYEAGLRGR